MAPNVDYSKWEKMALEEDALEVEAQPDQEGSPDEAFLNMAYQKELLDEPEVDKLKELKIKMAMDTYEKRRPTDRVMHHYLIKEAGDSDALGEYLPTSDERNDVPIYKNSKGLILSRERQPTGDGNMESFGWVIGHMAERRPLYGVMSEDLSVPTLGWQCFTAPEPVPTVRYFTHASAARVFKDRGNAAFQKKEYAEAETLYTKALECKMDPAAYAEPIGMILSNRAEARLRMNDFEGAASDAEHAMVCLRGVARDEESTITLKQKTIVRKAKALQALKKFTEASRVLLDARAAYPRNQELDRLREECNLALRTQESKASRSSVGGATETMLRFIATTTETIQNDIERLGTEVGALTFPPHLATNLKKLEYLLLKATEVEGSCLLDLQTMMRTSGALRMMLQLVREQWKSNLDGKLVDTFKLQALSSIACVMSLACIQHPENVKAISSESHCFFAVLGGCNRKIEADTCVRIINLVAAIWDTCKTRALELVQPHSIVVERAAGFLTKVVLAEPTHDAMGPDSPLLSESAKDTALMLLLDWLACGGRAEKRTLRGMVPCLADPEGGGFFTSSQVAARRVGELIVKKAVEDPQLVSPKDVMNMLIGINVLILSGPADQAGEDEMAIISVDEQQAPAPIRYVDLEDWETSEDGKHAVLLLQAVSKALEYRLLLKDRELDRDTFVQAFTEGGGFCTIIPLLQAPSALAEHALLCISSLCQYSEDLVLHIVNLPVIQALLGMPTPEAKPMPSYMDQTLKNSCLARKHTAKILAKCVETEAVVDLLKQTGEKFIKELIKLSMRVREDGKGNLESFHDMLHIIYMISQFRPGPLCRYIPVDMMNLLLDISHGKEDTLPRFYAQSTIDMLMRDSNCEKVLSPLVKRIEEGTAFSQDPEEELKLQAMLMPAMNPID